MALNHLRFSTLCLAGLLAVPTAASADEPTSAPPAQLVAEQPTTWRSYAFPAALGATGVSLLGAVAFQVAMNKREDEFNASPDLCATSKPNRGGPACADLHDGIQSAYRWRNISLASAGAFAVTALVLKLTEPKASAIPVMACAPGLGLSASCRLTF